tara:strand:- start:4824 stop:5216 length:393 start_codon:yes stop_codon:yes gene_type:complete
MKRSELVMALRPIIENLDFDKTPLKEELFQNEVLRPILKFQNPLIIDFFIHQCILYKSLYFRLEIDEKKQYINQLLLKNQNVRNTYIGILVGAMTSDEFKIYLSNKNHFNKRILDMISKRLKDQIQILLP